MTEEKEGTGVRTELDLEGLLDKDPPCGAVLKVGGVCGKPAKIRIRTWCTACEQVEPVFLCFFHFEYLKQDSTLWGPMDCVRCNAPASVRWETI
jgi:hypothetical protein